MQIHDCFMQENCIYPIITNFCLKAILLASFSGPAQPSVACSMDSDGRLGGAWEWGYILWNRWKCSSVWVFSYHTICLGVNMFNVQSVCSKARKILHLLYTRFYDNVPGSNSLLQLFTSLVRLHLDYASAIWSPYLSKENVQKFACCMATGLWDSSYIDLLELIDLPTLECRRLETWFSLLYKIINKLFYLVVELSL